MIHITTEGHEGWGDENVFYPGDPLEIVYNREVFFTRFLEEAPQDVYWFAEPDQKIKKLSPPLTCDLALIYRAGDGVPISPSFRLAKKSALPFFKEVLSLFDLSRKDWHGDSVAFAEIHKRMGEPAIGITQYKGMRVEFRHYDQYLPQDAKYIRHFKFKNKLALLEEC